MIEAIAAIAIVGYVIARQLLGEPIRGKRLILLPAILTVIGLLSLGGKGHEVTATSVAVIAASAALAALIGCLQGRAMRLSERDGSLFGQMPLWTLWLWAALILSRVAFIGLGSALDAHLASGTAPILFTLGINRLAQALMIAPRAWMAGIPFAPEKDGGVFLGQIFNQSSNPGR